MASISIGSPSGPAATISVPLPEPAAAVSVLPPEPATTISVPPPAATNGEHCMLQSLEPPSARKSPSET
ncbi:hypothetical protein BDR07DRAFT_1489871 [Suillus spraguei]|nr:hypothetical protein BDR07DRAFT_1489871 [Suillus spraguei]